MRISRRDILAGASAGSLLSAAGPGLRVSFAADAAANDILIVIYFRGGQDGLQLVAPAGDSNYITNRPTIRVQTTGNNAGLGLGTLNGTDFFFNSQVAELKELYDAGNLAVVHATGLLTTSRSHFDCQANMERGVADGDLAQKTGWIARHLMTKQGTQPVLATVANSTNLPESLLGSPTAIAIGNAASFTVSGSTANINAIRAMNGGTSSAYKAVAIETLDTVTAVQQGNATLPTGNTNPYGYTTGPLSVPLRSLASLIRMNAGVSTATVDMGGWDHHNNLVNEFTQRVQEMSRSLAAFWRDMTAAQMTSRITLITMTEFGRRFRENSNNGTDHGSASVMLALGGNVNGGKIHGDWPGLAASALDNGDLKVVNDYRRVLQEAIVRRHGETNPTGVFPTVPYAPLGIFKGVDTGVIPG